MKWPDVIRIETTFGYVVEDSAGRRFYGTLKSDTDGTLKITDITGTRTIAMVSAISIYPSSRTLWRRFHGSLDGGFTFTKSSTRSQFNLNADLRYRSLRWENQLDVESLISNSNGEKETDRDTLGFYSMRYLGSRWSLLSLAQYQHNLELGLSYRGSILGGIAHRLIQTDRSVFSVLGGIAFTRENYTGAPATSNGEAGFGTRYEFYKLYSPKIDIFVQFIVSPSLTSGGRVRTEWQSESKIELIRDFFWSVSFFDSYDSKPPGETNQKHDYGVSTGIGWSFG